LLYVINVVNLLETKKLQLSHQLATLTSTHNLATPPSTTTALPSDDTNLLTNLLTRTQQSDLKSLEKLHRIAGITLFIPNNPNEGSISQDGKADEFLGIRLETMQEGCSVLCLELMQGKFETPHYVILKKIEEGYTLHRHTIPSFIPLQDLCDEFLELGEKGLEQFALALHRYLIQLSNRGATVTRLRQLEGVQEVKADEAVRLVEVTTNDWIAKIVLQDKGERCVVVNHHNQRVQDVEKMILDGDADIVERISHAM
jgi:hypothetical protein